MKRRILRQINSHVGLDRETFEHILHHWWGVSLLVTIRCYEEPFEVDPGDGIGGVIPTQESLLLDLMLVSPLPDPDRFPEDRFPTYWAEKREERQSSVQRMLAVAQQAEQMVQEAA